MTRDQEIDLPEGSPLAMDGSATRPQVVQPLSDSRRARWFGADVSGATADRRTLYAATARTWDGGEELTSENAPTVDRPLSFDISNNQIAATVDVHGVVRSMAVAHGVRAAHGTRWHGVYVDKDLTLSRQPKTFTVGLGADRVGLAPPVTRLRLLGSFLPESEFSLGALTGSQVTFAPIGDGGRARPRAILSVLELVNGGDSAVSGWVRLPVVARPEALDPAAPHVRLGLHEGVALLGMVPTGVAQTEVRFTLGPNQRTTVEVALLLGRSRAEMLAALAEVGRKAVGEWLRETLENLGRQVGRLSIPGSDYYSELLTRQIELSRQSVLLDGAQEFVGGFWGSDLSGWPQVWMRDTYYQMLPLAWFAPELCRKAILFFTRWGVPPEPWGRALGRFSSSGSVVHSVGNAVAALALAGLYYQATGDREFFASHEEVYAAGRRTLGELLESRRDEAFLFPSLYISDGESAGDYHTGSNLVAWYAFSVLARIAADVYGDPAAGDWREAARRIRADVDSRCVGEGPFGRQFFEGAYADGSFVPGHDGEESDLTLAAVYGFCEADDPRLLNHARAAFTPANPGYLPRLDALSWRGERWYGPTAPGFVHALAGAASEDAVEAALERIRWRVDLDGSIWWWPQAHDWVDFARVKRGPGKSGWAAGVYVARFVHDILGLEVDLPARRLAFRPFCPWAQFTWNEVRLGAVLCDLEYARTESSALGRIVNRTRAPATATVELTLPGARRLTRFEVNGQDADRRVRLGSRYGRPSVLFSQELAPGQSLKLEVAWRDGSPKEACS